MKLEFPPAFFGYQPLSQAPHSLPPNKVPLYLLEAGQVEAVRYFYSHGADYGFNVWLKKYGSAGQDNDTKNRIILDQVDFTDRCSSYVLIVESRSDAAPHTEAQIDQLKQYYRMCRRNKYLYVLASTGISWVLAALLARSGLLDSALAVILMILVWLSSVLVIIGTTDRIDLFTDHDSCDYGHDLAWSVISFFVPMEINNAHILRYYSEMSRYALDQYIVEWGEQ